MLIDLILFIPFVFVFLGSCLLFVLSFSAFFSFSLNKKAFKDVNLVAVVPAHNEEKYIARTIESLLSSGFKNICVVLDHCTDTTEEIVKNYPIKILKREKQVKRGKNYALDFAFQTLLKKGFDAFFVVDADSVVQKNCYKEVLGALNQGALALQTRYQVLNREQSYRTRLMHLAFTAFNVVRAKGRKNLNLSCGIFGNGFALTKEVLKEVPYQVESIVEDLAYHLELIQKGFKVEFIDATAVFSSMPVSGSGVETQRSRWEGGRFSIMKEKLPLVTRQLFQGNIVFIDPLLDLMLLPLSYHLLLICLLFFSSFAFLAWIALSVLVFHLAVALFYSQPNKKDLAALFTLPFYLILEVFDDFQNI